MVQRLSGHAIVGLFGLCFGSWAWAGLTPANPTTPDTQQPPDLVVGQCDYAATEAEAVEACKTDPAACGITLEDVLGQVLFGETEPNDQMFSADPLTPDVPITGQLYSNTDVDWFFIETTHTNTIMSLSFPSQAASYLISVHDNAGNLLASATTPQAQSYAFDVTLAHAGVHYIKVETAGLGYTDNIYKMLMGLETTGHSDEQLPYNFHDVETEPNDLFSRADLLVSNYAVTGQSYRSWDVDLFRVDSPGNESLVLDFCGPNTICEDIGETDVLRDTWAVIVFDGAKVTDETLNITATSYHYDDSCYVETVITGGGDAEQQEPTVEEVVMPCTVELTSDNPYFVYWHGGYGDAVIAAIDPNFGLPSRIEVGLSNAGSYYIMVIPKLLLDDDGDVSFLIDDISEGRDVYGTFVEPFRTNPYHLKVQQTALTPTTGAAANPQLRTALEAMRGSLDNATHRMSIPQVKYQGQIYRMNLDGKTTKTGKMYFRLDTMDQVPDPYDVP